MLDPAKWKIQEEYKQSLIVRPFKAYGENIITKQLYSGKKNRNTQREARLFTPLDVRQLPSPNPYPLKSNQSIYLTTKSNIKNAMN